MLSVLELATAIAGTFGAMLDLPDRPQVRETLERAISTAGSAACCDLSIAGYGWEVGW